MARIHRRTLQKYLHDPDNHDGVITHLEPDIQECEVKWALESITMNKASGGDGIPVELFQILKDDAGASAAQGAGLNDMSLPGKWKEGVTARLLREWCAC